MRDMGLPLVWERKKVCDLLPSASRAHFVQSNYIPVTRSLTPTASRLSSSTIK